MKREFAVCGVLLNLNADDPHCDHDPMYDGQHKYDTELDHLEVTLGTLILQHLLGRQVSGELRWRRATSFRRLRIP